MKQKHGVVFTKFISIFVTFAGVIIILFSIAKILTAFQELKILYSPSPVYPLTFRQFYGLSGFIELIIGVFLLYKNYKPLKIVILTWITSVFSVYRLWLYIIGYKGPCGCLGNAYLWLGINNSVQKSIENAAFIYLLFCTLLGILYEYYKKKLDIFPQYF